MKAPTYTPKSLGTLIRLALREDGLHPLEIHEGEVHYRNAVALGKPLLVQILFNRTHNFTKKDIQRAFETQWLNRPERDQSLGANAYARSEPVFVNDGTAYVVAVQMYAVSL
jgi:hypothetical protein